MNAAAAMATAYVLKLLTGDNEIMYLMRYDSYHVLNCCGHFSLE